MVSNSDQIGDATEVLSIVDNLEPVGVQQWQEASARAEFVREDVLAAYQVGRTDAIIELMRRYVACSDRIGAWLALRYSPVKTFPALQMRLEAVAAELQSQSDREG